MDEPRLFADDPTTPMMEQYFRIKKAHPDAILFFRLGDFYEMFYEDAAVGSRVLEIALTSRQKVPMCGVPYHAVASYSAKLLRRGYKVAICEQVEDPKLAKGVVKREVIKILTPGDRGRGRPGNGQGERLYRRPGRRRRGLGPGLDRPLVGRNAGPGRNGRRNEAADRRTGQGRPEGNRPPRRGGERLRAAP